jgi:hypothetical protein
MSAKNFLNRYNINHKTLLNVKKALHAVVLQAGELQVQDSKKMSSLEAKGFA